MGVCGSFSPVMAAPCPQKGELTFADRNGAFFSPFHAFWNPPRLTTKAFVLLDNQSNVRNAATALATEATIARIAVINEAFTKFMFFRSCS